MRMARLIGVSLGASTPIPVGARRARGVKINSQSKNVPYYVTCVFLQRDYPRVRPGREKGFTRRWNHQEHAPPRLAPAPLPRLGIALLVAVHRRQHRFGGGGPHRRCPGQRDGANDRRQHVDRLDRDSANPAPRGTAPITCAYSGRSAARTATRATTSAAATSQTYTVEQEDNGDTLRVTVTAKKPGNKGRQRAPQRQHRRRIRPHEQRSTTIRCEHSPREHRHHTERQLVTAAQPISFTYPRWQKCAMPTATHAAISARATSQSFQLQKEDVDDTLRVQVTTKNSSGSSSSTSVPSAKDRERTRRATGSRRSPGRELGAGERRRRLAGTTPGRELRVVAADDLRQLRLRSRSRCTSPARAATRCRTAEALRDCRPRSTRSASPSKQTTDTNGDTVLQFNRFHGFPAARSQRLMVPFVRASRAGDNVLAGVSTRRLVSLHVNLNQGT